MKNLFKKIGALLVAAVMVLSMCTAVFAEGPTAQIRIKNAGTNATFDYLQVIVPDTHKETGWAFATPAIAEKYKTVFNEQDDQTIIKKMIVLESANTKYEGTEPATTGQIENALEAVLGDSSIMGAATRAATAPITVTSAGVYAIKGTEDGYAYSAMAAYIAFKEYNITTGVPSNLENKEIEAKKTPTKIEKTSDDSDKVVEIGRQVTYTVTGTVPYLPSTQERFYKIKDTIKGASYNVETEGAHKNELKVAVKIGDTSYERYVSVSKDGSSFELDLSDFVKTNDNAKKTITITYGATVTDTYVGNTVVAGDGNNWSKPNYGSKTEELFTGRISITKTGESKEVLEGAGFKVYKEETKNNETVKKYAKFDNNKLAGWTTNEAEATEITTGADGTVTISGLDLGTYKFKEVTAPRGYSINTNDASGTIALTTGKEKAESADDIVATNATMSDTKLNSLPSTGGMGTYLFTIIGVVVMAGAAGAFFISRRKGSEE